MIAVNIRSTPLTVFSCELLVSQMYSFYSNAGDITENADFLPLLCRAVHSRSLLSLYVQMFVSPLSVCIL